MYNIGDIIRTTRIEQKVTQEELCSGLCSVSNLSRIESMWQVPNMALFEALMSKLGKDVEIYTPMAGQDDIDKYVLRQKIRKHITYKEFDKAESLLSVLEEKSNLGVIYKQFIQYTKAVVLFNRSKEREDLLLALDMLLKAIVITFPDYTYSSLSKHILTREEVTIVNNIANVHSMLGERKLAIEEFYALKEYYDNKMVDTEEKAIMYTMILYNLSRLLGLENRHDECIKLCDIGIECCIDHGKLTTMPQLLLNKGCSLLESGDIEQAMPILQESYFIYRAVKRLDACMKIENYIKDKGISIDYIPSPLGLSSK